MEDAQSQLMNATSSANDFSKGTLTKAGLLEKAVDLVKLLADENKKLKMVYTVPEMGTFVLGFSHGLFALVDDSRPTPASSDDASIRSQPGSELGALSSCDAIRWADDAAPRRHWKYDKLSVVCRKCPDANGFVSPSASLPCGLQWDQGIGLDLRGHASAGRLDTNAGPQILPNEQLLWQ